MDSVATVAIATELPLQRAKNMQVRLSAVIAWVLSDTMHKLRFFCNLLLILHVNDFVQLQKLPHSCSHSILGQMPQRRRLPAPDRFNAGASSPSNVNSWPIIEEVPFI